MTDNRTVDHAIMGAPIATRPAGSYDWLVYDDVFFLLTFVRYLSSIQMR
jgi:hypothetical protein